MSCFTLGARSGVDPLDDLADVIIIAAAVAMRAVAGGAVDAAAHLDRRLEVVTQRAGP
jgi:hypothetical protein